MREPIVIQTDVLSVDTCKYLINFFEDHIHSLGWSNSVPLFSHRTIAFRTINPRESEQHRLAAQYLNQARLKACNVLKNSFAIEEIYPEYTEIVAWPPGTGQPVHRDTTRPTTTYAAIFYLNDDFTGGETIFPTVPKLITPQTGMLVGFQGGNLDHGVSVVSGGTRFTVPCWFTDQCDHAE